MAGAFTERRKGREGEMERERQKESMSEGERGTD